MKKVMFVVPLVLRCALPSLATSLPPFAGQCAVMDRIALAAGAAQTRSISIDTLEKVALVKAADIGADAELAFGLPAGMFKDKAFADPAVRVCALRSLGRTAIDEAVEFLRKLSPDELGPDDSQRVRPAAEIALRDAQFRRILDPSEKIKFLEGVVARTPDGHRSRAATWAIDELCNRGAQMSLPVIQEAILSTRHDQYALDRIEFCEARIRVVMSNPDRTKALGSVLTIRDEIYNRDLVGWAINELDSLQTPDAGAELDRFAREIASLPESSPRKETLLRYQQVIEESRIRRAK